MNAQTGEFFLVREIDLEKLPNPTLSLQIQASQVDNPLRQVLARVDITVQDINDNSPEVSVLYIIASSLAKLISIVNCINQYINCGAINVQLTVIIIFSSNNVNWSTIDHFASQLILLLLLFPLQKLFMNLISEQSRFYH